MGDWTIAFEQRLQVPRWWKVAHPVLSVSLALLLGAALLWFTGLDPWNTYGQIGNAAFGSAYGWSDTAVKATPIMLTALGVTIAFRLKLWNIGAEGQMYMGAWAASGVALGWLPSSAPSWLMLTVMMLAGTLAGGLWGAIPGALRAKLGVNEIITTLMLNYIAFEWVRYYVFGPWSQGGFQLTAQFPKSAWLPRLSDASGVVPSFSGLTVHLGLGFALLTAAALAVLLKRSRWGMRLRIMGDNPRAAAYAGVAVTRQLIIVMVVSGALAGLAGMTEVSGVVHRLQDRFSPGYGFTGIIVAWLAKLNPWSVVWVALLFGGLLVGGKQIQPSGIPQMLQGLILLVVAGGEVLLRYRLKVARRTEAAR